MYLLLYMFTKRKSGVSLSHHLYFYNNFHYEHKYVLKNLNSK